MIKLREMIFSIIVMFSLLFLAISVPALINGSIDMQNNTMHKVPCYDKYGSEIEGLICKSYNNEDLESNAMMAILSLAMLVGSVSILVRKD